MLKQPQIKNAPTDEATWKEHVIFAVNYLTLLLAAVPWSVLIFSDLAWNRFVAIEGHLPLFTVNEAKRAARADALLNQYYELSWLSALLSVVAALLCLLLFAIQFKKMSPTFKLVILAVFFVSWVFMILARNDAFPVVAWVFWS